MHKYLLHLFTSIAFIAIGVILTVNWISNVKYVNSSNLNYKTNSYFYDISTNPTIYLNNSYETITDNSLDDNTIRVDINYYSEAINISKYSDTNKIKINVNENNFMTIYNDAIMSLKNNVIYDYNTLYKVKIKIYVNQNTIFKLKIND